MKWVIPAARTASHTWGSSFILSKFSVIISCVSASEFISDNFTRNLRLDDICAAAGLSQSHLIRAFKGQYGMTPHAYLINRRIQFSRARLRQGLNLLGPDDVI